MFIKSLSLWACSLLLHSVYSAPVYSIDNAVKLQTSLSKRTISGPEIGGVNFPDPSILQVNGVWYAFATRTIGSSIHVQLATSKDFESWAMVYNSDGSQRDALPNLPSWVDDSNVLSSKVWGPDVNVLDDGTFIMYYSAVATADSSKHCIAAATSSTILGPYTPQADTLVCPLSQGGAIDPAGYNDNGQRYLVYKVDGNSLGNGGPCGNTVAPLVSTPLILQPVSSNGLSLSGPAYEILDNNGASDQGIVEVPSLVKSGSTYFLFFSSGCFTTGEYDVDYATATSITGPYTRAASPLIQTGPGGLTAPGGADVTRGGEKLLFHANHAGGRALYTSTINISGTKVVQA